MAIRRTFSAERNHVETIYAGRIAPEKRVVELRGALAPLLRARPEVKLLVVGSGPAEPALAAAVEAHRVAAQVIRAGRVEWLQMHHFYSVAHLFVTASLSEMQPMTLIEAALCGLPVVARRDLAYAGLVRDGYNGYQAPSDLDLADRVADLFQDEAKRRTLAHHAHVVSEAFSAESHVAQVESLYCEVIARRMVPGTGRSCSRPRDGAREHDRPVPGTN